MSDRVERPGSGIQDANSGGTDRLSERTRRPRPEARLHLSPNQRAWRRFRRNRLATGSGIFLSAVVLLILIWPWFEQPGVARHLPKAMTWPSTTLSDAQFQPPSAEHGFGTDVHGRDLLSRVFSGARISLLVGVVGAVVSLVIGVLWGAIAGFAGGRWDSVMMRFVDILYSLPSIVFVMVLITAMSGLLEKWRTPAVGVSDFRNPSMLFTRLQAAKEPGAEWLRKRMDAEFLKQLANYKPGQPPDETLQTALADQLNKLQNGPPLFDERWSVPLRPKTRSLLQGRPLGEAAVWLNRYLLEDAFPNELRPRETWFTILLSGLFSAKFGATTQMLLLFVGLGAMSWLTMARIVRGQVLSLRSRGFVDASRALGASQARLLLRHILPNLYGIIMTYLTPTVPSIILYESFLSYLGLGIQPPQASLGSLIAEGAAQINPIRTYWWMIVFPGVTLASTLLSLNFLGDGLRDAWDPRTGSE